MHARLDELLSLRDGVPTDATVRAHVQACPACAAELARFGALRERMRNLPPVAAPAVDGWPEIRARIEAPGARRTRAVRAAPYAAAASVAALAMFAALRVFEPPQTPAQQRTPLLVLEGESLDQLRSRSRELEQLLAALPQRPAVERAATSVPIDALEAQVQWLDHQLTLAGADGRAPDEARLWRDRVEVMNSLVQLRVVEAQHVNL